MRLAVEGPMIGLITDGQANAENFPHSSCRILDIIRVAVDNRVSFVQIREKQLSARLLFLLARDAAAVTGGSNTKLLINDRADIAAASGADGVHLTSHSLPVSDVRAAFGDGMFIGVSTHSIQEVETAAKGGADLAVFGPVFETQGKSEPIGIHKLKQACLAVIPFPVLALGGIDGSNFEKVLDAGAAGFAAIRWLNNVRTLPRTCEAIRRGNVK